MFAALLSVNVASAQGLLSDVKFNLSVGLTTTSCDKKYDQAKLGWGLGIDAQKPILHYPNDASTIYGLVGLHLDKKGGKTSNDFLALMDDNENILTTNLKVPVRAGFSYQFSKISLFIDLGPYIAFKVGGSAPEEVEISSTEIGFGTTFGVKFKRFAIAWGADKGLTNFATMKTEDGEIKMKNTTAHFDLRWTLGH